MHKNPLRVAILIVPLLLPLGGCAGLAEAAMGLPSGTLTKSVQNPVTRNDLRRVESTIRLVVAGAQTYKNYCEKRPVGDHCDTVVDQLQSYSRRSRPLERQLRVFVRKNDQVNASLVFTTIKALIADYKSLGAREGLPVQQIEVP